MRISIHLIISIVTIVSFEAVAGPVESVRRAVEHLQRTYPAQYRRGEEFLSRLDAVEARMAGGDQNNVAGKKLDELTREALIANPLVSGRPVVFVTRKQYRSDHHNTATMFQTGEINANKFDGGGAVKSIDFATGQTRTILELPRGVARDPEVSFDGTKLVVSIRKDIKDDYHIYEVDVPGVNSQSDGSGLRQLTFGGGVSDIDPLYLPDGSIVFTSTREPKFCMCNRHIMGNLFKMNSDGSNIHQIGHSTLHEGHGTLMPDGRILYDRWEYVDRNFGDAQGLWTVNPDGTNHAVYWANNTTSPGAVLDARVIPGTGRFISTFSSCHDRPWGAIAIVDRRLGIDGKAPVVRCWPPSSSNLVMKGNYDTFKRVKPKYEDPYPLSDSFFLCSRQVKGAQMGIVLLDVFGNELLLHTEAPGCYDPMPLGPKPRPTRIPRRTDLSRDTGSFYVADVYAGGGMQGVERGTAKYLRVVESPEKRFWTQTNWNGSGTQAPAMAWDDFNNKRILGTVPIQEDGSAYFEVPADKFVYFQVLDEKKMMIQSMRSGTIVRPGEETGCIGCHEHRLSAMPKGGMPQALKNPPRQLEPWYGPARKFSFLAEVQPVFDKYCIKCHDYGGKGAKKLILAGDIGNVFNASYVALRGGNYVKVPGAGPARFLPPYGWGSHKSKLANVLMKGHNDLNLDKESFERIVTWIDINAPYHPSYASAYPKNRYGRSPLTNKQLARLGELTGINLRNQRSEMRVQQVNFNRPAKSPCLAKLPDKTGEKYKEALEIIRSGKKMLARKPRMEMAGAGLVGLEVEREKKYDLLQRIEMKARKAIAEGRKASSKELSPGQ